MKWNILSINYLKIFIFYLAGFGHKDHPQSIDLNCVRLCYQVFLEGSEKGAFTFALKPVVSDPIYDKSKAIHFYSYLVIFFSLEY